ncbi:hypothetical protein QQ045_020145 [Rhodiola kirilowii]
MSRLGFSSLADFLLPKSVEGCKAMLSVAVYKKFWFPDRLFWDFLEVMFNYRKERSGLLEALVISNQDHNIPKLPTVSFSAEDTPYCGERTMRHSS